MPMLSLKLDFGLSSLDVNSVGQRTHLLGQWNWCEDINGGYAHGNFSL
jgi:hypothetical protein